MRALESMYQPVTIDVKKDHVSAADGAIASALRLSAFRCSRRRVTRTVKARTRASEALAKGRSSLANFNRIAKQQDASGNVMPPLSAFAVLRTAMTQNGVG